MKKFVMGVVLITLSAVAVSASNSALPQDNKTKTECKKGECKNGECKKGEKRTAKSFVESKAFEGINLTDAQKSKLEELSKANRAQRDEKSVQKPDKEDKKNLSKEDLQKMQSDIKAKRAENKNKFLNDVKSVLTPEQYTKFLENSYKMAGNQKGKGIRQGGKHMKGQMHAQKGKKGMRGSENRQMGSTKKFNKNKNNEVKTATAV